MGGTDSARCRSLASNASVFAGSGRRGLASATCHPQLPDHIPTLNNMHPPSIPLHPFSLEPTHPLPESDTIAARL